MSTNVVVEISPETTTRPVLTSVSHATRPFGSSFMTASRTPSEIWSATLSGWPSVSDSDVKRYSFSEKVVLIARCVQLRGSGKGSKSGRGRVARSWQSAVGSWQCAPPLLPTADCPLSTVSVALLASAIVDHQRDAFHAIALA